MDVREMLNVLRPYFSSSTRPVAGGATTQVQFNTSGVLAGDAGLVWDNTNKRLGIGTTAPSHLLHLSSNGPTAAVRMDNGTPTTGKNWMVQSVSDGSFRITQPGIIDAFAVRPTTGYVGILTMLPTSPLQVVGLPIYANNAAAVAGGLTVGAFYRTGADPDPVCVVH